MPRWKGLLWRAGEEPSSFDLSADELRLGSHEACELRLPADTPRHACTLRLEDGGGISLLPLCGLVHLGGIRRHAMRDVDLRHGLTVTSIHAHQTVFALRKLEVGGLPSSPQTVPPPRPRLTLYWRDGDGVAHAREFSQEWILLGRDPRCDVVLHDREVEPFAMALGYFRGRWLGVYAPERMRSASAYAYCAVHLDVGHLFGLGDCDLHLDADLTFERLVPLGTPEAPSVRRASGRPGALIVGWTASLGEPPEVRVWSDDVVALAGQRTLVFDHHRGTWALRGASRAVAHLSPHDWLELPGGVSLAHVRVEV